MATKIKAGLVFDYNLLPVYLDDNTKIDNVLSDFNIANLIDVINLKNENEFAIKMISIDLVLNRITVFSELFYSQSQFFKTWNISEFTAPQQTIINDFIALL